MEYDYCGLIWISLCAGIFAFFVNKRARVFWTKAFAISAGTLFIAVNAPGFTHLSPTLKSMIALIPLPCFVLFVHDVSRKLPKTDTVRLFLDCIGPSCLGIFGVAMYGYQIPERWFPGCCDLTGGSHTIHHLWSTAYSLWMLRNVLAWSKWRNKEELCLPS